MKKKIALVTGGAGFIGSHMVDLLIAKNFKVIVLDNLTGGHKKRNARGSTRASLLPSRPSWLGLPHIQRRKWILI